MIDTPKIVTLQPQTFAKIHQVIPREQIRQVMGQAIGEINAAIKAQGLAVTGPWFTHHLKQPGEQFDFEVCFPVDRPVAPTGRVQPGEWPAMSVVQTVYQGGYDGLGAAWGEFMEWIERNGHHIAGDFWERYLSGPESGTDASAWRTELNCPLVHNPA